jgi:hypothetical protein
MRHRSRVILILCCLAVAGCRSRDTTRKLSASDVVGTWRMRPAAKSMVDKDGVAGAVGKPYTITFNADGAMVFASVFDDMRGGTYRECGGTWHLEHDTTGDSGDRKANTIRMELADGNGTNIHYLNFTGDGARLLLWNYYGDPDSAEYIEYELQ